MKISAKRQQALKADIPTVEQLYRAAIERWGLEAITKDSTLLWTLRCMWGCTEQLPFQEGMVATNLTEFMYVAKVLCGYGPGIDRGATQQTRIECRTRSPHATSRY